MIKIIEDADLTILEAQFSGGDKLNERQAYLLVTGLSEQGRTTEAAKIADLFLEKGCSSGALAFADKGAMDMESRKKWLRKALDGGNGEAAYMLGSIYYDEGDYVLAKALYERAVELKFHEATVALGFLYEEGEGVPQDYLKAARAFMGIMECGDGPLEIIHIAEECWPVDSRKGWHDFKKLRQYMESLDEEQRHDLLSITKCEPPTRPLSSKRRLQDIFALVDDARVSDEELRRLVRDMAKKR